MKKILYIPLDERPCNTTFLSSISSGTDYLVTIPECTLKGNKKTPANTDEIWKWTLNNINNFDAAIISVDMLLYGGIVPSRRHYLSIEKCLQVTNNIQKLKAINPALKIYAFNLIMRCPSYSSSDEEPDYYSSFGSEIFQYGILKHKTELNILKPDEKEALNKLNNLLPITILEDYITRRQTNVEVNKLVINLVEKNFIDFLVIPQDDSAPLGFTAMDQQILRDYIHINKLDFKVLMYPGADEVSLTLFARLVNEDKKLKPCIYTRYSSTKGPFITPLYEDRMLNETVKYHILSAGGIPVESINDADIVLMVNSPAEKMCEAWEQSTATSPANRNLIEFIEFIDYIVNVKKLPCALADSAYSNGGDVNLVDNLSNKGLLFKLASYAGWNTNANTLGTAICQSIIYNIYGKTNNHLDFLALRYAEDLGYCSVIRKMVTDQFLPALGMDYFKVDGPNGKIAEIVQNELQKFCDNNLKDNDLHIKITSTYMPWSRMFETGLKVKAEKNN
jgi:hypothetical protein